MVVTEHEERKKKLTQASIVLSLNLFLLVPLSLFLVVYHILKCQNPLWLLVLGFSLSILAWVAYKSGMVSRAGKILRRDPTVSYDPLK